MRYIVALILALTFAGGCASTAPKDNPPPKFEYDDE
jgi:hypothetical protein